MTANASRGILSKAPALALLGIMIQLFLALGEALAEDGNAAGCSAVERSGSRKIEAEREKEAERRKNSYPDKDSEKSFLEQCLGSVYQHVPFPGFPPVATPEDMVKELCREARRELGSATSVLGGYTRLLGRVIGTNTAAPWNGLINEEIWNALFE
jgi:hypothetical protein